MTQPIESAPIAPEILARLRACSTATLTTQLFKRGYRQQFLVGLAPLNPDAGSFAGPAFTLRFIPSREDRDWDLGDLHKRGDDNVQWEAVEATPTGHVLVIDSRQDIRAASAGNMLLTRLMVRGAAAAITDGAFRDGREIAAMPFPAYCAANTASTRPAYHRAVDMQRPIGCAGVAVYPGDIVVGDVDGVVIVPHVIAADLAKDAFAQEKREAWLFSRIRDGAELWGTYPPDKRTLAAYEAETLSKQELSK